MGTGLLTTSPDALARLAALGALGCWLTSLSSLGTALGAGIVTALSALAAASAAASRLVNGGALGASGGRASPDGAPDMRSARGLWVRFSDAATDSAWCSSSRRRLSSSWWWSAVPFSEGGGDRAKPTKRAILEGDRSPGEEDSTESGDGGVSSRDLLSDLVREISAARA